MKEFLFSIYAALVLLFATGCSQPDTSDSDIKIVGGEEVTTQDVVTRSTVALVNTRGKAFCTGSLITRIHVLTAAHCLVNYRERGLFVAFGPKATRGNFAIERLRLANFYKTHEDFSPQAMRSLSDPTPPADIALVQLSEPAPSAYQPASLLSARSQLRAGEPLVLAGFGITHYESRDAGTLRKVTTKFRTLLRSKKELMYGTTPGKSACKGDSGGPAFVKRGSRLALIGVTSRGPRVCDAVGIYTDARVYRDWLVTAIREGRQES